MVATAYAIFLSKSFDKVSNLPCKTDECKSDEFLKTWKDQNETYLDLSEQWEVKMWIVYNVFGKGRDKSLKI